MSSRGARGEVVDVDAAFDALRGALDVLAGSSWWQVASGDLGVWVQRLQVVESRVAAAQVAVLGEAVGRGVPAADGAKSAAVWLRGLVPVTPGVAGARARLAEALHPLEASGSDLSLTREAFGAGRIGAGQAGAIVRTMAAVDELPVGVDEKTRGEVQELLVDAGTRLDPAQLGKAGLRVRHRLDPDAAQRLARDEDAQDRAREAWLFQDSGSGMWHLQANLPPVAGACLQAALDPLAAPRPAADGTPDSRTGRQRTADALCLLAEGALAARTGTGGLPTRGGAPTRLTVTADLSTLTANLTAASRAGGGGLVGVAPGTLDTGQPGGGGLVGVAPGTLDTGQPGGWEISPLTTQMLACDAEVVPILLDDQTGRPLDVGDTIYPFPPKIRRAITARDRHCTYPGCQAPPPWCHAHHLIPFNRSRKTSEDNGTLLCGHHHRLVHARGWTGRLINGHIHWQPPSRNTPDTSGTSDPPPDHRNAHTQDFEQALHHLAHRWQARQQPPDDTG